MDFNEAMKRAIAPATRKVAGYQVQRLLGYWMMLHMVGGFDELVETGWLSRAGCYLQRNQFRAAFGVDAEDWLPEIAQTLAPKTEPVP